MSFIEFDYSSKVFYILGNGMFCFLTYFGVRDLYSLMFSMTLTIIISLLLLYYGTKSSMNESIISLSNISEEEIIEEDKIKIPKVNNKIDNSLGLNKIQNKCFSYGIIFLLYLILNIFPYLNSLCELKIKMVYEFLSLVAMILTYYLLLHEKLFRHHLFGLFIIFSLVF